MKIRKGGITREVPKERLGEYLSKGYEVVEKQEPPAKTPKERGGKHAGTAETAAGDGK